MIGVCRKRVVWNVSRVAVRVRVLCSGFKALNPKLRWWRVGACRRGYRYCGLQTAAWKEQGSGNGKGMIEQNRVPWRPC